VPYLDSRVVLASTVLLATLPASAQPVPKVSTREEYRACLEEQERMAPKLSVLKARHVEHNADLKSLQDESKAHAETQSTLDSYDQEAVDAYNAKSDTLNLRAEELNKRAEKYDKEMAEYNASISAMNKRCAGMVFLLRDRDAVARERAAAKARK
jgi:hypothetical protein